MYIISELFLIIRRSPADLNSLLAPKYHAFLQAAWPEMGWASMSLGINSLASRLGIDGAGVVNLKLLSQFTF